ncbi:methionyl-tRNA formyltransferase-like protein [Dokdonella koreensis]|uniref:methionyl-tRNA formyltransferase-like protein n=1 Tax=Dokdonella koreensis TaxID=323415 RepID=UPI0012374D2C|nr:methionyl-tRNA formyltransferase-like protein [Dokdonella koreensis]
MKDFDRHFVEATAAIGPEYFLLPIVVKDSVFRERVYCYELYHQLRQRWPVALENPWRLSGEVDKRSHQYFRHEGARAPKPDFLVHQPGFHQNFAVMEIKPPGVKLAGVRKDVATLDRFTRKFGYKRGIMLIYGLQPDKALGQFHKVVGDRDQGRLELWVHPVQGQVAFRLI